MTEPTSPALPARLPRLGVWVSLTVAAWHLAFFATGAVTLALASSPTGSVFEGLAEPFHQKLMLASHLRVLAGYAVVGLGAFALAYPIVRLWTGTAAVSRWGLVARTLVVLGVLMVHGWLRLAHTQPYFLGPTTYDTWYFQALGHLPEEARARIFFVLFGFLPAVVLVAAAGVYVVEAARWFRDGGRAARLGLAAAGTATVLATGWWVAPHFVSASKSESDGRLNVLLLSSDEVRTADGSSANAASRPHLSALAAKSVVLTNVRSPVTTALGAAASLHTGQAPHTHTLQTPFPSRDRVARALATAPQLPVLLGSRGYATAVLGDTAASAFALAHGLGFADVEACATSAYPSHLAGMVYPAHFIIPAWLDNRVGRRLLPDLAVLPGRVSHDTVTDRLTQRLEHNAETGTPFFLHGIYSAPSADSPWPLSRSPEPPTESFDHQLARVLECLEDNGLRDNTIILVLGASPSEPIFAEDRAPASTPVVTDTPIPVVLSVPGDVFAPGIVPQLGRLYDLAPTLLDVLGLPSEASMDGVSLRPCLENRSVTLPLVAFGESGGFSDSLPGHAASESTRMTFREGVHLDPASGYRLVLRDEESALRRKTRWVRTTHWQLIFTPAASSPDGVDAWHLYDLRADPATTRDVKLQNPKVWQSLEIALRRWADEKTESRLDDIFPDGEPLAAILPGT